MKPHETFHLSIIQDGTLTTAHKARTAMTHDLWPVWNVLFPQGAQFRWGRQSPHSAAAAPGSQTVCSACFQNAQQRAIWRALQSRELIHMNNKANI